jgi:N-acetylglutamate synthase-like GNAT family acetyltransferase
MWKDDSMQTEIRIASRSDVAAVQELWREYWGSLGLGADFQKFGEECRSLPGVYASPKGRLLVAVNEGAAVGTAALRPLADGACEAKRLYVRAANRGSGIGKALLQRLMVEARQEGYAVMYADTLPSMAAALGLYKAMGFVEVGAYSDDPTPGAVYLGVMVSDTELAAGDGADN